MRQAICLLALVLAASAFKMRDEVVGDPIPCIKEKCPKEWAECEKDTKCQPALEECAKKCGSKASCWEFCLPGKHSQAAIDTAKCAHAQGCDKEAYLPVVFSSPQDCIEKYCKKEEELCKNDRRCIGTLEFCDHRCNTSVECWRECLTHAKEQNATNYIRCIVEHNCTNATQVRTARTELENVLAVFRPEDCIKENCPTEARACAQNSSCLNALKACENECKDNQTCWTSCVSKKGNPEASALWKCIIDNDCLNKVNAVNNALAVFSSPEDCIKENCPTQATQCALDPNCVVALNACGEKCQDNVTCWTDCLAKAGNDPAMAFWKCILDNDCLNKVTEVAIIEDPESCMKEKCPGEYDKCQKDSSCPKVIQECQKKCGTKSSCWEFCLGGKHNQHAIDLVKCAHANGCDKQKVEQTHPFLACMERSCVAAQVECLYDKECTSTIHKCASIEQFSYDQECLFAEAKKSVSVGKWYECAGEHFCL